MFGEKPTLAEEEYKALAGVWRVDLDLDGRKSSVCLHLALPQVQQPLATVHTEHDLRTEWGLPAPQQSLHDDSDDAAFPTGGSVFAVDDNLPFGACEERGWTWSAGRHVCAGAEGDDLLRLTLQLGELSLEGQGQRGGLRCRTFVGKVLESGATAGRVGRFAMRLSLPIKTDTWELERRYQRRIASRPPPPLVYPRLGFVGRWRLLMFMGDEGSPPAYFPIQLHPDGSWQSAGAAHALAGTWGMYARDASSASGWSDAQQPPAGTSVWLSVHSERCTHSPRGVGGLPVRSDFHFWGTPVREEAAEGGAQHEAAEGAQQEPPTAHGPSGGDGVADRVDGRLWVEGSAASSWQPEYFGRFSLVRGWALTREEQAKRDWLGRLGAGRWGSKAGG